VSAATGSTRAVVVDDSRFMRTLIRRLLEEEGIEVVDEAADGVEAVETVASSRPDVVTMDIEMPRQNGIEAVGDIMNDCPTPVLILSAHADEGASVTFEALDRGAVDFVTKPGGEVSSEMPKVRRELVSKVREAAAVDLAAARATRRTPARQTAGTGGAAARSFPDVATLVIGASTGGPNVVEGVLAGLPREANLRVLVVQHMPEGFTARFADRLDKRSAYQVREARDGDRIGPGEARVAPGGAHLRVTDDRGGRLRLELDSSPPLHGTRPAVDHAMSSASDVVSGPLVGAILTGMGRDGVDGMTDIRRAGGATVAQDESTSAIFGMPKRAIEAGCVERVLPAERLAEGVLDAIERD